MMARSTPHVNGTVLVGRDGDPRTIAVGSPAWYAWLEAATTFTFTSAHGGFSARKERSGQGWYWKAYRKQAGVLYRAYLGKSSDLSHDQLTAVASRLARRATGPPPDVAFTVA